MEARWKHRPRKQTSASSNALPITHSETCSALERKGKAAGYPSEVCGLQRRLLRALSDRSTFDRRPLSGSNLAETSRSPGFRNRQLIADTGHMPETEKCLATSFFTDLTVIANARHGGYGFFVPIRFAQTV